MKFIDDQGRLFGLINVIDLAVLLVVAALLVGITITVGMPALRGRGVLTNEYHVTVLCKGTKGAVYENLQPGAQMIYGNVYVNGYILDASVSEATETVILSDGTVTEVVIPNLRDVLVTIRVVSDRTDGMIMIGPYQVNIGKPLFVKTNRVEVEGTVLDIVQS